MKNYKQGFTLIELLVVVAIIGMLLSIIVVAFGNARLKSRDTKRLSDMQQIKLGLDVYYSTGSGYSSTATWNSLQAVNGQLTCSGTDIMRVPQDMLYIPNPAYAYEYTQGGMATPGCDGTVYSNYKLKFQTEGGTDLGPAGIYYLSPAGITATAPF